MPLATQTSVRIHRAGICSYTHSVMAPRLDERPPASGCQHGSSSTGKQHSQHTAVGSSGISALFAISHQQPQQPFRQAAIRFSCSLQSTGIWPQRRQLTVLWPSSTHPRRSHHLQQRRLQQQHSVSAQAAASQHTAVGIGVSAFSLQLQQPGTFRRQRQFCFHFGHRHVHTSRNAYTYHSQRTRIIGPQPRRLNLLR